MMRLKERGMKIRMEKYGADKEPEFKPELKKMRDDMLRKVNIPVDEDDNVDNNDLSNLPPLEEAGDEISSIPKKETTLSESKAPIRSYTLMSTKGVKIEIESDSESDSESVNESESESESELDNSNIFNVSSTVPKKNLIEEIDNDVSHKTKINNRPLIQEINDESNKMPEYKNDLIIEDIGSESESDKDEKPIIEELDSSKENKILIEEIKEDKPIIEEIIVENKEEESKPLIEEIIIENKEESKPLIEEISIENKNEESKPLIEEISIENKEEESKPLIEEISIETKEEESKSLIEEISVENKKEEDSKSLVEEIDKNEDNKPLNEGYIKENDDINIEENKDKEQLIEDLSNINEDKEVIQEHVIEDLGSLPEHGNNKLEFNEYQPKSLAETLINKMSSGNSVLDVLNNELKRNIDEKDTDSVDSEAELIIDEEEVTNEVLKEKFNIKEEMPVSKTSFKENNNELTSLENNITPKEEESECEDLEAEIINDDN